MLFWRKVARSGWNDGSKTRAPGLAMAEIEQSELSARERAMAAKTASDRRSRSDAEEEEGRPVRPYAHSGGTGRHGQRMERRCACTGQHGRRRTRGTAAGIRGEVNRGDDGMGRSASACLRRQRAGHGQRQGAACG